MTEEEAFYNGIVSYDELEAFDKRLACCLDDEILLANDLEDRLEEEGYYLTDKERSTHMHVLGSTGSGKSKLLESMIRQDIQRNVGVCLIDPHGELYYNILFYIIKECDEEIQKKVYLVNPNSKNYLVSFNPFVRSSSVSPEVHANRMFELLEKVWGQNFSDKPTLSRSLYNAFFTASVREMSFPDLIDLVNPTNEDKRIKLVDSFTTNPLGDKDVENWWREVSGLMSRGGRKTNIDIELTPVYSRLYRVATSKLLLMSLQNTNLNFKEIIENDGILLVNLAEGNDLDKKTAKLIGLMMTSELLSIFKSRSEYFRFATDPNKQKEWNPFYFYVDEFHEFWTPDFKLILSGGRKFGIHLILANQTFDQIRSLDESIYSEVMGNTKVKCYFALEGFTDSLQAAEQFIPLGDEIKHIERRYKEIKNIHYEPTPNDRIPKFTTETIENTTWKTPQEIRDPQARKIQNLKQRTFIFRSDEQKEIVFLITDWVFDIECFEEEIEEFEKFVYLTHLDCYERLPVLMKKLKKFKTDNPVKKMKGFSGGTEDTFA
ncbi:MAG: DUF87 domain-containing protein [Calditrichaeota bacterium]|nr:MAG: DUF87 domain-containing protein [Calditrichota bacterium]